MFASEKVNEIYHVLLSNEALNKAVRERFLEGYGKCGVLGVPIEGDHSAA